MDEGLTLLLIRRQISRKGALPGRPADWRPPLLVRVPPLDINEMHEFSAEQLESLARDFDLRLHSTRSIHQHIVVSFARG